MNIIEIDSLSVPGLAPYASLTEAQLLNRVCPEDGLFIAESPKVIRVALDAGLEPVSLLCERRHITGDASDIVARMGELPVYTGGRDVLARLTGYTLTRGVLCAMRRPRARSYKDICAGARRLVVMDGVTDTTNIGAIFRSAAALGIDGVLLTETCCDALNRRAVRVSMGSVFLVPWGRIGDGAREGSCGGSGFLGGSRRGTDDACGAVGWQELLRAEGFRTVAMALRDDSVAIDDDCLKCEERLAIVMGTEGDGLSQSVIDGADYVARIPMAHGVDSLNVAAAAALAFWEMGKIS